MAIAPIGSIALPAAPAAPAAPSGGADPSASGGKGGFGNLLSNALGKLDASQQAASTASEQLATGQATDISGVAMSVEEASLSLQLAVQVRDKLVNAYDTLFQMQV